MKNRLDEVIVIRLVLIVLLVAYHSFCIYSGAWKSLEGQPEIKAYWWISRSSYSFMLESFIMISGYLFALQIEKGRITSGKNLFLNKAKRLMLTSIVFSLMYILLFHPEPSKYGMVYDMINGAGHMWFLPMLFECFLVSYYLRKIKVKEELKLFLFLGVAMYPPLTLPLQIGFTLHYLFFFYLGIYLWQHRDSLLRYINVKSIAILVVLFLSVFIFALNQGNQWIEWCLTPVYACLGCLMILLVSLKIHLKYKISNWLVSANYMCFGVYLFQQFILKALYYDTSLPAELGFYALPWCGFVVALIGSLFLTYFVRLSKIGKYLIG